MKKIKQITLLFILVFLNHISFSMVAPNTCATAGDLSVLASPYSGTTVGASNDFAFCTMRAAPDQIFYYDVPNGSTIQIRQTVNAYDSRHSLRYSGACPGTIQIVCTDDPDTQIETWQNCTGSTQRVYWIQSGFGSGSGTYTIQWQVTAGVCGACPVDQVIASTPFSQTGLTTAGAGDDFDNTDACASNYMNGDDYVFEYTPAANECVNISLTNTSTWVGLFVTDGCPSTGVCIASNTNSAGNPSLSGVNLTAGTTYYFTVSTFPAPQTTPFDISIVACPPPPANDDCGGAIALTVNPDLLCGTVTSSTVASATNSGIAGCAGTADDDVWFSFVATSTVHNFDVLNVAGSVTDMVHEIFSGTCPGGLASVACSDPNASQFSGFTIGNTYYVRVYTFTGTGGQNTTFDFCVGTPPPPPSNDEPCGATILTVNSGSCSYTSAVLPNTATTSTGMPAPGCGSLSEDIWFQVTVPAGGLIIDLSNNGGPTDMAMAWYTSSTNNCNNLDGLVECDDDDSQNGAMPMICRTGASCTVPGDCAQNALLPAGTTIWVRVWEFGGGTSGPFDICAYEPPPAGGVVNCGNATNIPSLPFNNTGETTCCRGNTYNSTDGCLSAYQDGEDFMYTYTPAANETIDISLTGTSTFTGVFITDACPSAGGVNCVGSSTSTTGNPSLCGVNLTAGTTYYIMIDTDPNPTCTPFNINITTSTTPSCGLNYTYDNTIAFAPDLNAGTNIALPIDDRFSSSYIPIGFDFCYDGFQFSQCLISSNGYVIFDPISCASNLPGGNAAPGGTSDWSISAAIPNTTDAPRNSIMFPWQDINPALGGTIRYQTLGVAPNRRFVVTFDQVPYFSCTALLFTGQLKLFETTNNIEMHIANKEICAGWNGGDAILGLHNYNGTAAVLGVNFPTNWNGTNLAARFTYNCAGPCINVLPVTLLDFYGTPEDNSNLIEWATASEINNSFFLLERSSDGIEFEEIAKITGGGNSTSLLKYQYQHQNPNDLEYYRLKQVDFDGQFEYSKVIAINSMKEAIINIFPNPTNSTLSLSFMDNITSGEYVITITDVLGKVFIKKLNVNPNNRLFLIEEFESFAKGFYTIKISDGSDNILKSSKVIKN